MTQHRGTVIMNVYDFDHTIYAGDCTLDFWQFCVRKRPSALLALPGALLTALKFMLGLCDREMFKETFYRFLRHVPDVDQYIQAFWSTNLRKVCSWYMERRRNEDLIISASPDFLIAEACKALGVRWLASPVDRTTGKLLGPNCRGEEKVRRLQEALPQAKVCEVYSDSLSDAPLAAIAERAYLVKKNQIIKWDIELKRH